MSPAKRKTSSTSSTVDEAEVERFSALAADWWDPRGKMAPLHKFNPVRLGYIRDRAADQFGRDPKQLGCLEGSAHSRHRLRRRHPVGAAGAARRARWSAPIRRRRTSRRRSCTPRSPASTSTTAPTTAEALADAGERFDVVLAMEVVEHVTDVNLFVGRCAEMVKPGGLMIAATLNRTLKSFALAIVGAEYVLRWLPLGTHSWDKFVTPNELEIAMEQGGLRVIDEQRRDLQFVARRVAALERHRRELHADGGAREVGLTWL